MNSVVFEEKLELVQSIVRELWGFYSVSDLRELRQLIRDRKRLANQRHYAKQNSKTGATEQKKTTELGDNASGFTDLGDWEAISI